MLVPLLQPVNMDVTIQIQTTVSELSSAMLFSVIYSHMRVASYVDYLI